MDKNLGNPTWKRAKCVCGAVEIKVNVDLHAGTWRCNCTKCTKRGGWSAGVPLDAVEIVAGQENIEVGPPNPIWQGRSCAKCHSVLFGVMMAKEVGGPRKTVNVRMLEDVSLEGVPVHWLDGLNDTGAHLGTVLYEKPDFL